MISSSDCLSHFQIVLKAEEVQRAAIYPIAWSGSPEQRHLKIRGRRQILRGPSSARSLDEVTPFKSSTRR